MADACRRLVLAPLLAPLLAATPAPAQTAGETARVATELLNLRRGPGAAHDVVQRMPEGTRLLVTDRQEGWARVTLEADPNVSGWTSARYLETVAAALPAAAAAAFADLLAEHGPPEGQGYVAALDLHYIHFCNNGFGIALYRPGADGGSLWQSDDWCVRQVQPRDIDGDGREEIVYFASGGGSGGFGVKERHLSWPPDAAEPQRGYDFLTLNHSESAVPDAAVLAMHEERREMHYGRDCGDGVYTPDWPPDQPSRPVTICAMTEEKTLRLRPMSGGGLVPDEPAVADYILSNARQGFRVAPDTLPPRLRALAQENYVAGGGRDGALERLNLGDLAALDTGERIEMSAERKAMIADWLE